MTDLPSLTFIPRHRGEEPYNAGGERGGSNGSRAKGSEWATMRSFLLNPFAVLMHNWSAAKRAQPSAVTHPNSSDICNYRDRAD